MAFSGRSQQSTTVRAPTARTGPRNEPTTSTCVSSNYINRMALPNESCRGRGLYAPVYQTPRKQLPITSMIRDHVRTDGGEYWRWAISIQGL